MNVLELCLSPDLGGLELYVFRSAKALDSRNHRVLAVLNKSGKLTKHFKSHLNIKATHLKYSPGYLPIFNAHRLAKIIDTNDIDVIHMHWGNDFALAALAKKMSHLKPGLVYTRQMQITRNKNDLYHRFLYQQMDLMLTITKQLENNARGFITKFADRITTLYYGVDKPGHTLSQSEKNTRRQELGLSDNDFVVGLFGRLEANKGQHLLIKAVALAKKDGPRLKALIVGHEMTAGYRDELRALANSLGVTRQIAFKDFVNDPQSLMQLCDCVTLTSYNETFGMVLPEAMRAGVAVIGSNKGGVTEIIDDGSTGVLFESRSSSSLCKQLLRLYNEPELRSSLAKQGENKADSVFNDTTHFNNFEKLIETIAR
jgi:glycosyltransferase involved in cell wall biosynthesis